MQTESDKVTTPADVLALRYAVKDHEEAEREVRRCRDNLRFAEKTEQSRKAQVGACVRVLRGRLGISAETMARRYLGGWQGASGVLEYVKFEDTGELSEFTRKDMVRRLLEEAANAE